MSISQEESTTAPALAHMKASIYLIFKHVSNRPQCLESLSLNFCISKKSLLTLHGYEVRGWERKQCSYERRCLEDLFNHTYIHKGKLNTIMRLTIHQSPAFTAVSLATIPRSYPPLTTISDPVAAHRGKSRILGSCSCEGRAIFQADSRRSRTSPNQFPPGSTALAPRDLAHG